MNTIAAFQLTDLMKHLPVWAAPQLATPPYLAPEIQVGDSIDYTPGAFPSVFPIPTNTLTIEANGVAVASGSAPTYTAVGVGVQHMIAQTVDNGTTPSSLNSGNVTVISKRTATSAKFLGGNAGGPASYSGNIFHSNCAIRGLSIVNYGAGGSTGYTGGRDASGNPLSSSSWWISTPTFGTTFDGCTPASVDASSNALLPGNPGSGPLKAYRCTYTCTVATTSTDVVAQSGCSVANWASLGSNQFYFELTITRSGGQQPNVCIGFQKPISNLDIPWDGATPTSVAGEFLPANLTNAAQFTSLRLMDVCNTNLTTDTTWSSRIPDGSAYTGFAWERIFRYCNAVASASGSVCKQFWICLPHGCDDNYVTQCVTLANSILLPGVHITLEWSNEPWNPAFVTLGYAYTQAFTEACTVSNYAVVSGDTAHQNFISSITSSGGVATVTLTKNINQFFLADGTTPFITNGASIYAYNKTTSTWNGTSSGTSVGSSAAAQQIVTVTTGGALLATQFQYPCATTAPATMTTSDPITFYFNTASTLVSDKTNFDSLTFSMKWMTRRAKQCAALWKAVRPTDEIAVNLQQYPGALSASLQSNGGIANSPPLFFNYGNWLGDGTTGTAGLKTWCDIAAIAPYVFPSASTCSTTSGSNVIANVPWASSAVVGDSVMMYGGTGINSVVAPGSSGTNLVVADNATATVTGTATAMYGVVLEVQGYISGTTLTVTATNSINSTSSFLRACKGAKVYDTGGLIPAGTTLSAYGTATGTDSGIVGTYTLSANVGTIFSAGSPGTIKIGSGDTVAILQAMLQSGVAEASLYIRAHVYECGIYGIKPYAYEGGPDTSRQYSLMSELWTYGQNNTPPSPVITMGTVISALYDACVGAGLQAFHHFIIGPSPKSDSVNAFGNTYAINQSFGDQNPAYAAVIVYAGKQLSVTGKNACPGTADAASNVYNPTGNIQTSGNATGMCYWASNAADRRLDIDLPVNRSRRYQLVVWGSDSAASTVDVYLNETFIAAVTLPANGAGNLTTTTPAVQTSAALQIPLISSGPNRISLRMPAGRGTNAGIRRVATSTY